MAIPFLHNINLSGNEIQNVKLHNTSSAPVAAAVGNQGQLYFNTTASTGVDGAGKKVYISTDVTTVNTYAYEALAFESWVSDNFNNYSLPLAADGTRGGIQIGYTENAQNYPVELNSEKAFVNVPWTDTVDMGDGFTVSADTNTATTTITEGDTLTISGGTNVITVSNPDGTITINATDTDTTYSAGTGLSLDGTTFNVNVGATGTTQAPETITTTTNRLYQVETDDEDNLVVNVPWVDTDTNTDTLQSISAASTDDSNYYLTSVLNATGAQTGYSHTALRFNPSTETLVTQNLIVSGTSTTINTETINLADNIITLNSNFTGDPDTVIEDAGIEVERGTGDNVKLFWDESEDAWTVTNTTGDFQILQAVGAPGGKIKVPLTVDAAPTADNVTSVTKTSNKYTINHSLATQDLIIQLVNISGVTPTYETVFADIERPTTGTITVDFANTVTDGDYKLLATQI